MKRKVWRGVFELWERTAVLDVSRKVVPDKASLTFHWLSSTDLQPLDWHYLFLDSCTRVEKMTVAHTKSHPTKLHTQNLTLQLGEPLPLVEWKLPLFLWYHELLFPSGCYGRYLHSQSFPARLWVFGVGEWSWEPSKHGSPQLEEKAFCYCYISMACLFRLSCWTD